MKYNTTVFKFIEDNKFYYEKIGGVKMLQSEAAKRVDAIIKEKGYKQCAIAKKAGFNQRNFNDVLCGRKIFRVDYVIPICTALNVTPNDLFGFSSGERERG